MTDDSLDPELQRRADELFAATQSSLTIDASKRLRIALAVKAALDDRTVEYIAQRLLEEWARKEADSAERLVAVIEGREQPPALQGPAKKSERVYRDELTDALATLGLHARTEVSTGVGIADIAIYIEGTPKPLAIIEVKVAIHGWRECHHATGQARAYAKAAGARLWFVVGAEIEPRLLKDPVYLLSDAPAAIHAAIQTKLTA